MAEANNTNLATEAFTVATSITKLGATDRSAYAAAARKYALTGATAPNAAFWNALASVLEQPSSVAAQSVLKQAALSVSASTAAALRAWQPGLDAKAATATSNKLPTWVWLAAAGLGLYAWKGR